MLAQLFYSYYYVFNQSTTAITIMIKQHNYSLCNEPNIDFSGTTQYTGILLFWLNLNSTPIKLLESELQHSELLLDKMSMTSVMLMHDKFYDQQFTDEIRMLAMPINLKLFKAMSLG